MKTLLTAWSAAISVLVHALAIVLLPLLPDVPQSADPFNTYISFLPPRAECWSGDAPLDPMNALSPARNDENVLRQAEMNGEPMLGELDLVQLFVSKPRPECGGCMQGETPFRDDLNSPPILMPLTLDVLHEGELNASLEGTPTTWPRSSCGDWGANRKRIRCLAIRCQRCGRCHPPR